VVDSAYALEPHLDDYRVYQTLAISLVVIPTYNGRHAFGLKMLFFSKLQEPSHSA
jgi:hypothetical protein